MPSFEDRLKKQFGDSLPEGEKLYTKENLKAVEEIKSLINGDLSEILHQLIILDLKTRLTTEGQKRLDDFFKMIDKDDYHNDRFFLNFSELVNRGLSLFLFQAMGKIENLTGTYGHTKWTTSDLHKEYLELNQELKSVFESDTDGKYTSEQKEEIKSRNDELAELVEDLSIEKKKSQNEKALEEDSKPVAEMPLASQEAEVKTVGQLFTESDAYKNYVGTGVKGIDSKIETKTTLTTTGYPPEPLRQPGILETALRDPNAVISLFDIINTDQNAFSYLEETTFTNNAAEAAEGSAVGEAALAFTEKTEAIRKMGVFIPVTDQLLADEAGIQGYLNSRLQTMINLRLDSQLLNGDGTAPNIEGLLDAGKSSVGSSDFNSYNGNLGRIGKIYDESETRCKSR